MDCESGVGDEDPEKNFTRLKDDFEKNLLLTEKGGVKRNVTKSWEINVTTTL